MTMATTNPTPEQLAALARHLDDPMWRLTHLYKIVSKGDDEDSEGLVMTFKPNRAQRRLLARLWHRSLILKARQMGFSTLICMLWLDTAAWAKEPMKCAIIAQDKEAAEELFGKITFAYDNLPDDVREMLPLRRRTTSLLEFGNNGSKIIVRTSVRGGTTHRLHISEFGKICAKAPDKAREVVTGSIPSVPKSGICVIESTAEGQEGKFYEYTQQAKAAQEMGKTLTPKDWRFHFFPWYEMPEYTLDAPGMVLTVPELKYITETEGKIGQRLTQGQWAWYFTTLRGDFQNEAPLMWQEFPSYPDEAFQVSTEGCYYANQLALARTQGRIVPQLPIESAPVNTFWDIGRGDMTSVWFHQRVGPENRFIRYYENSGEDLSHYVTELQKLGFVWGRFYLPHDAAHKRMGATPDTNKSIEEMLQGLMPGIRTEIVPRVTTITAGIEATRGAFGSAWFCEAGTAEGLKRLGNYRKKWNKALGCWSDEPQHDDNSHGSDAFRQYGQVAASGGVFASASPSAVAKPSNAWRRRRSGMAV
jgi:hypothetical protein